MQTNSKPRTPMPSDSQSVDLKEDAPSHDPDSLAVAMADLIHDRIVDAGTLRDCRKKFAGLLVFIAALFYMVLFGMICRILSENVPAIISEQPYIFITIAVICAVIPTLIIICVARAIFSGNSQAMDAIYSPIQAILHLMKEMKS